MNTLSKLTLLACAFMSVTACNEKVSAELKSGNSTSSSSGGGGSTVIVPPDTYYFRVTDSSDTMLNFKLHKTGAGNANVDCGISNTTGFSSDLYRASTSTYDITCYYDAEELSLWYNGPSFKLESSKNTCEYVGYGPFSYFNFQPGDSSQSLVHITCTDDTTQGQADAAMLANYGINSNYMCNRYTNPTLGNPFETTSVDQLCAFNHALVTESAPNCDVGVIDVTNYDVSRVDTDGDGTTDLTKIVKTTAKTRCGGKAVNCINGPIKQEGELAAKTSGIVVTRTTVNGNYEKDYKLTAPKDLNYTNLYYLNYRRDLASLNIEYGNSNRGRGTASTADDQDLTGSYMASFADPLYKYVFDPELMQQYANNKRMDGSTLVSATDRANASLIIGGGLTSAVPSAADPFLGVGGNKTNPYYTLYCFDGALDVKARIRMVIRDWDRVLSTSATSTSFERISDVDSLPPTARQDVPYTEEVTGDPDSWNDFNDMWDWDDIVDMERDDSGAPYDPSITIWRPYPIGSYDTNPLTGTNGFFNPLYFPREMPE